MNKIALVTGANRGIGFATVKELLKKSYTVILTSRKEDSGMKAFSKLEKYGDLHFHKLDVCDPESINAIKTFVENQFGRLDILINNAGINFDTWHTASNANLIEIQETIDTNLMGAWRMSQAFIPMMKNQKYGRIVNVSSGAGSFANMGAKTPGYSISKAAMNALTIQLAAELKSYHILVNSVCPGWVRTDMGGMAAPRSAKKGSETIIWAEELENNGPSGKFFRDQKEIEW